MLKTKTKAYIGIIVAIVMVIALATVGGFNLASTSAEAYYGVAANAYDVELSQTAPGEVIVEEEDGQYYLSLQVNDFDPFDYYYMVANVNDESVELYNRGDGLFTGVVSVVTGDTIVLTTTSPKTLSATVTLESLFLSSENDYTLSNVKISSTHLPIGVTAEAESYNIEVSLGVDRLNEGESIYVRAAGQGDNVPLTATDFYGVYSGQVTFVEGATSLEIWVEGSTETYTATISLAEVVTYDALPVTEADAATLSAWTPVIYSYSLPKDMETGYYTINATISAENDYSVLISLKNDPESYEGTTTGGDIPMYLVAPEYDEEGEIVTPSVYYFEVTLFPEGNYMGEANVYFTIEKWSVPTLTVNSPVWAPVTDETMEHVVIPVELETTAEEVNYEFSLSELPDIFYMFGETVYAHIITGKDEEGNDIEQVLPLTSDNGYASDIQLSGSVSIYLTAVDFAVVSLRIIVPEVIVPIVPDTPLVITIPANSYVNRYIEEAAEGFYSIAISEVGVEVSTGTEGELAIIPEGKTMGGFRVSYYTEDFGLRFTNYTDSDITITATLSNVIENVSIDLGARNTITLPANSRKAYYLNGFVEGSYTLGFIGLTAANAPYVTLTEESYDAENHVYSFKEVAIANNVATVDVSQPQDANGIATLIFENSGSEEISFIVYPTPVKTLTTNRITSITVEGDYLYTAYYFNTTSTGLYAIALDLPEGMDVTVSANLRDVVYYGSTSGIIDVTEAGYIALRFNCYNYSASNSFDVYISAIDGSMELGVATEVTVDANALAKTYSLGTLNAGLYTVTSDSAYEIVVNGYKLSDTNTFEITNYEQDSYITFYGNSDEAVTFSATVELTDSYVLKLDEAKEITLAGYGYREYFIELEAGTYDIELVGSGVLIRVYGEQVVDYTSTSGSFTISADNAGTVAIVVDNYNSQEPVTVTVTISKVE